MCVSVCVCVCVCVLLFAVPVPLPTICAGVAHPTRARPAELWLVVPVAPFSLPPVWENVYGFDMSSIKEIALLEPLVDTVPPASIVSDFCPILTIDMHTVGALAGACVSFLPPTPALLP